MSDIGFRRGAEEAEKSSKSGNWAKAHFLDLDDKESVVLRFLSDHTDWLTVDQHQIIPTKPKPSDYEGQNWPEKMGAVCRNTKMENGRLLYENLGETEPCYICANIVDGKKIKRPSSRTWAIACIREEVIGDGSDQLGGEAMKGKRVGYRDATRTVTRKKEGSEETEDVIEKALIFVNQGWKNFFTTLKGFAGHFGTLCDQDFKITRSGTDTDTDYSIIPLGQVPVAGGGVFDTRNPEHLKRYGFDSPDDVWKALCDQVADRASLKLYARFFDRTKTVDKDGNVVALDAATVASANKPSNDAESSPDRLQALASRIQNYAPQGDANGQQEAAQPVPEPAPAPAQPDVPSVPAGATQGPIDLG